MVRAEVQLSDEEFEKLERLAAVRHVPVTQLLQEGVQRVLSEEAEQERFWERLWQAVGTCHDPEGADGVAENHDLFLSKIYAGETDLR